jgi:hypothetical protein
MDANSPSGKTQELQNPATPLERLKDILALLTTVGAIITTLGGLPSGIAGFIPIFRNASPVESLAIAGILTLLALILWRNRLQRRSRLLHPEALILKPELNHLVGREDDIRNLLNLCGNESLIWLVGESGTGKSALVRAGLLPALRHAGRLALLIDNWGADWIKGPQDALLNAISAELDSPTRQQLQLDSSATLDHIGNALISLRESRGLPIIIFDQFDDYQVRHRSEFVAESGQTLLTVDELTKNNPFWGQIRRLVEQDAIHCLLVTRSDTLSGYGLECVRFCEPRIYPLARLAPGYALALLEKITSDNVIANRDQGFDRLKRRLCHDLEAEGDVLPIRMKLVFRSLVGLQDDLTIRGYMRAGGLSGLEASYIQNIVAQAAQVANVDQADVRNILLALTDPSAGKTVPLTDTELLQVLPPDRRSQRKLEVLLNSLQDKEIIRKRLDVDKQATVRLLDHDYLCQGILELERQRSYWQRVLDDAYRSFVEASGIWGKFKALPRPRLQLQLAVARCRGSLHYGTARMFALLSSGRLLINPVTVVLLGLGFALVRANTADQDRQADWLFTHAQEANGLWAVSHSSYTIRRKVLEEFLASSPNGANAKQFVRNQNVTYAVVGLDPATRARIVRDVFKPRCQVLTKDPDISLACALMALNLDLDWDDKTAGGIILNAFGTASDEAQEGTLQNILAAGDTTDEVAQAELGSLLRLLKTTQGSYASTYRIDNELESASRTWNSNQALEATDQLLKIVPLGTDAYWLNAAGRPIGSTITKLTTYCQAETAAEWILGLMQSPQLTSQRIPALEPALMVIAHKLNSSQAEKAADRLTATEFNLVLTNNISSIFFALNDKLSDTEAWKISARVLAFMQGEQDPRLLAAHGRMLAALAGRLKDDQAQQAATLLRTNMMTVTVRPESSALSDALVELIQNSKDNQRQQAWADLLATMEAQKGRSVYRLEWLGRTLAAGAEELAESQIEEGSNLLLEALENTTMQLDLQMLEPAFAKIMTAKPNKSLVQKDSESLLAAMERTLDQDQIATLGQALGAIAGGNLSDNQRQKASGLLVDSIKTTTETTQLNEIETAWESLTKGDNDQSQLAEISEYLLSVELKTDQQVDSTFNNLAVKVNNKEADVIEEQLLSAIENNPDKWRTLSTLMKTFASRLTTSQLQEDLDTLLKSMEKNANPVQLINLGQILEVLGTGQLTESQAEKASSLFLEAMKTTSGQQEADLSSLLSQVARGLNNNQLESLSNQVLGLIGKTTDDSQAEAFATALAGVLPRLKGDQAEKTSARLIEVIPMVTNQKLLESLGHVLAQDPYLGDSQKLRALKLFLETMKDINSVPNPLCSIAPSLITESTLPMIVDLLKWPTCASHDRDILVERIANLKGLSFGGADDVRGDHVHLWEFATWAEKQSYSVSGPPAEYPSF